MYSIARALAVVFSIVMIFIGAVVVTYTPVDEPKRYIDIPAGSFVSVERGNNYVKVYRMEANSRISVTDGHFMLHREGIEPVVIDCGEVVEISIQFAGKE